MEKEKQRIVDAVYLGSEAEIGYRRELRKDIEGGNCLIRLWSNADIYIKELKEQNKKITKANHDMAEELFWKKLEILKLQEELRQLKTGWYD